MGIFVLGRNHTTMLAKPPKKPAPSTGMPGPFSNSDREMASGNNCCRLGGREDATAVAVASGR
jgi:hypothetical protein